MKIRALALLVIAGAAACRAPGPQDRAGGVLEGLADAPCTMMSAQRRQSLRLAEIPADPKSPNTCQWSSDSSPSFYGLTFTADPTPQQRQEYTRGRELSPVTVENRQVTQVTAPVVNLTSCAEIVDYGDSHGFIVSILEPSSGDACLLARAYARSTILFIQESG